MGRQPGQRIRRSAEEAKTLILNAAEQRLKEHGPEGLRLQDVARDAGVSHSLILHHFGNRAGFEQELANRLSQRISTIMFQMLMAGNQDGGFDVRAMVDQMFSAMNEDSIAVLMTWMAWKQAESPFASGFAPIEEMARVARNLIYGVPGENDEGAPRSLEETKLMSMTILIWAYAMTMVGNTMLGLAGYGDSDEHMERVKTWLAEMVSEYLAAGHDLPALRSDPAG